MTPEGKIKKQVKLVLSKYQPMYGNWPVPGGYGEPMLDFVGCFHGQFFMVETKVVGESLTPRQNLTKELVEEAGGKVFVIEGGTGDPESWPGYLELLEWLRST